jgi:hypothetical protein
MKLLVAILVTRAKTNTTDADEGYQELVHVTSFFYNTRYIF